MLKEAGTCIKNTIPHEDWWSGNEFFYDYLVNISYQWDPLNHHDYLHWWKYDGPEAWRAGCHFSDTIHRCLQPVMEQKIDLTDYRLNTYVWIIIQSLFYLTLCQHQAVLANNAVCIHSRMLSDDVLSCSGVLAWRTGNFLLYFHRILDPVPDPTYVYYRSESTVNIAVYKCIYTRGQWKRACGESVDETISKIVNNFSSIVKYSSYRSGDMIGSILCDACKNGSNLKIFKHFNVMKFDLLESLLYLNQSPDLYKECQVVDYPLNHCHMKNIWRRDLFNLFCHQVNVVIAPQLEPYLPLCDFAEWIQSAERICNIGYDRFMEVAGHIEHCTDGKDELFPCYKGLYIDRRMSWGLITASRVWSYSYINNRGSIYRAVYPRIKECSKLVYDHLSVTCRHGPVVVRLIQDIRTVLSIGQSDINSFGEGWQTLHHGMAKYKQHVLQC